MRPISIVFTKSKKKFPIFSWLIRLWTQKPYSHVARRVDVGSWGPSYYQASESKVNYEYYTVFESKHKIIKEYTIEVPKEMEMDIKKACYQEAGKKYAIKQNIGIAIVNVASLFGIKMANPWKTGRNCSELLYIHILKKLHPELEYDPDTIRPDHIEEILDTCCEHVIIDKKCINN